MYGIEEDEGFAKPEPKWLRLRRNQEVTDHYKNGFKLLTEAEVNRPEPKRKPYVSKREQLLPQLREPVKQLSISQRKVNLAEWFQNKEADLDRVVSQQLQKGIDYQTIYDWSLVKRIELNERYIYRLNILEAQEEDEEW